MSIDPVSLSIFSSRLSAVCDEMGVSMRRSAFSPNIRDRFDFSCAVFDPEGLLCAQAAHIPVHLGSMAYAMRDVVAGRDWRPGDMLILNDPFLGGTHLPDVTVVAPVHCENALAGFVVNRAHHADIGSETPGSMPLSHTLDEEGIVISPALLVKEGRVVEDFMADLVGRTGNPQLTRGDFAAQISANRVGAERLSKLVGRQGHPVFLTGLAALNKYAERLSRATVMDIPDGDYEFEDFMDDDGLGTKDIAIRVNVSVRGDRAVVDFEGTDPQVPGNLNCPVSVAAAGALYVFRCLMPPQALDCDGLFRPVELRVPEGCVLNAQPPAAVAAGNVETSTRVVDVVCGALSLAVPEAVPAASQGTMNNLAMGSRDGERAWDYYETIAGGMGAGCSGGGLSAVHTHMTNTRNTPVEIIESSYPLRVTHYSVRRNSGGAGVQAGGDGLVREFEFLAETSVSLLTERRRRAPWGLQGGGAGQPGENRLDGHPLPGKTVFGATSGQRLRIATPGGGGYGRAESGNPE